MVIISCGFIRHHFSNNHTRQIIFNHISIPLCSSVLLSLQGRFDPCKFSSIHMARVHSLVVESLMDDEKNQIRGYTHINDESGLTMSHLSAWSFTDIRNMLRCIQNSTPMRHKETHFINIPTSVAKIIEFAISLLNDKLKSRVMVNIVDYISRDNVNLHDR